MYSFLYTLSQNPWYIAFCAVCLAIWVIWYNKNSIHSARVMESMKVWVNMWEYMLHCLVKVSNPQWSVKIFIITKFIVVSVCNLLKACAVYACFLHWMLILIISLGVDIPLFFYYIYIVLKHNLVCNIVQFGPVLHHKVWKYWAHIHLMLFSFAFFYTLSHFQCL